MRQPWAFVDAVLSRFNLWPVALGIALLGAGYVTGLLAQVWTFSVWLQAAIFIGAGLILLWILLRLAELALRPSPRALHADILALWREGDAFVQSGVFEGPDWSKWRAVVVRVYGRWAYARDSAWLLKAFTPTLQGTQAAMAGLIELSDRFKVE